MNNAEEQLKTMHERVAKFREQMRQLIKSADNIAKDAALNAVCGNPADRTKNEESAKRWNKRNEDLTEALELLDRNV